jgi:hypothetical protein
MLTAEEVGPPAVIVCTECGVWAHLHATDRILNCLPASAMAGVIVTDTIVGLFFAVHYKASSKAFFLQC